MNLVVDIGNTNLKYFLFSKGLILESFKKDFISNEKFLKEIKNKFSSIKYIIYSDVRNNEDLNFSKYFTQTLIIRCSSKLKLPFKSQPVKQKSTKIIVVYLCGGSGKTVIL